jgi:deoxyadenosine/deoxycytidine kinase
MRLIHIEQRFERLLARLHRRQRPVKKTNKTKKQKTSHEH